MTPPPYPLKGNYHLSNFSRIEYFEFYKSTGACPTRTRFPKHEIWINDFRLIRESRKCKQNTLITIFMMAAALIGDVYNAYYETITTTAASGKRGKILTKTWQRYQFSSSFWLPEKITRA